MKTKTLRIPEDLLNIILYRAKREEVEESTATRQLIKLGAIEYAVRLYKDGKITLREAAKLANVSLRRMLDVLMDHGVKGNVSMSQQQAALKLAKKMK